MEDLRLKGEGHRNKGEQERQHYPWTGHVALIPGLPGRQTAQRGAAQTGAGTPNARLSSQPAIVSSTTPTSTSSIWRGVWSRPEATMIVVAPAGGWAARRTRSTPPVSATANAIAQTRLNVIPAT